jgi:N-acetylmuramic acid 6-phosphate (MurNAc-6-P) etherase
MSIYSGFATRNQEQTYDKMLYNLISTLLLRLGKFYKREPVDENTFLKIVFDQEKSLRKMEKHKVILV